MKHLMPYVKKSKKRVYRKNNRRRPRRRVFRPQRIIRTGFPKTTAVKLRYVDNIELNPTAGVIASHSFRANGIYDPDLTGVGHQPLAFDQWSAFYNHYTVVGAKIKATFSSKTSSPATNGFAINGINLQDDGVFTSDVFHMMEQGLTRVHKQSVHTNAQRIKSVTKGFSAKKFFNVTNVLDVSRVGAHVTTTPTDQAIFVVFSGNADSVVDPEPMTVLVEIEYIVIFSEPKELVQS